MSSNKLNVVVFGVSAYSKLVAGYIDESEAYNFEGFCVDDPESVCASDRHRVMSYEFVCQNYAPEATGVFSAIGYRSFSNRQACFQRWQQSGFKLVTLVCKSAYVHPSVSLGENCIVMPNAVIEAGARVEDNVTIWSNATICHDSSVLSHSFIAANATIGGGAKVGRACFMGFSSTILDGVELGDSSLLGAMSLLNKNGAKLTKYIGVPAKPNDQFDRDGVLVS